MAKLLLNWLNNDVKLSSVIYSLEEDFKDGYFLGELLHKYNQQLDFDKFVARNHPDSKIKNFCLVEPTMRNVGVNFGSKIAADIMAGREGAIKTLLYELKTALDGIDRNSRQTTNPNLRGTRNDKILFAINPSKPSFDKTKSVSFENAIRAAAENPNDIMMRSATLKFQDRKQNFRNTVNVGHSVMLNSMSVDLQRTKEIDRSKKANEGEFADAWESINLNQWKENQRIARERRNLKQRVELEQSLKKEKNVNLISNKTRDHTIFSLDEFDRRLDLLIVTNAEKKNSKTDTQKLELIKAIQKVPGGASPTLMYVDQAVLKEGFESSQKKMKEHHENGINRQKMHDRRRRKFLREYDTMQSKSSHKFFEDELVTQLLNECKDEVVEEDTFRRVVDYKKVILDNRCNRSTLIESMSKTDSDRHQLWEQIEADRELDWVVEPMLQSQALRRNVLQSAAAAANRQQSFEVVSEVVDKIVDMTAWVISCRSVGLYDYKVKEELNGASFTNPLRRTASTLESRDEDIDSSVLSKVIFTDAVEIFTSSLKIPLSLPLPEPIEVSSALVPFSISQRPKCSNADWLFSSLLQSHNALSNLKVDQNAAAEITTTVETEKDINGVPSIKSGVSFWKVQESPSNELTTHLAVVDSTQFTMSVNEQSTENSNVGNVKAAREGNEVEDIYGDIDMALPPTWIPQTPSNYFLGETIVAIRCAVEPVPEDPVAVIDTSHIVLRCALCGISDLQRLSLATALKNSIPNIKVIKVEELIQKAVSFDSAADEVIAALKSTVIGEEIDTESVEYMKEAKRIRLLEEYISVAKIVKGSLSIGAVIAEDISVALIIHEINMIPEKNNGFVIQDFPNTKAELSLLMKAISGIDFESKRPQPADKASIYAPIKPCETLRYDTKKCGLDCVLYLHSSTNDGNVSALKNYEKAVEERVRVRKDLVSGELVYISKDNCKSVATLKELYTPHRTAHTAGIDLTVAEGLTSELVEFLVDLNLLDSLDFSSFSSISEAVESKATELRDKYIPPEHLAADYFDETVLSTNVEENVAVEEVKESTNVEDGAEADDLADSASVIQDLQFEESEEIAQDIPPQPVDPILTFPPLRLQNSIPDQLAQVLSKMWALSESQSTIQAQKFFTAQRDVRFEMVQRRRIGYDCVNKFLVCIDNRQQLISDFRAKFNAVDEDMRFDADCVAELGLRNLELCDEMAKLSETHKKDAEELAKKFAADAALQVMIHQSRCDAVIFVQTAVHRFNTSLHLLFDCTKSLMKYECQTRVANDIEITLPVTEFSSTGSRPASSKRGKDAKPDPAAAKKGKVDPNLPPPIIPFREPVVASLVPKEVMRALPNPTDTEDTATDAAAVKGKKLPAGKSSKALPVVTDPFEEVEKAVQDLLKQWGRDTFVVNRQLYEKDETTCAALENAIWFEADKLKIFVAKVKSALVQHVTLLEEMEAQTMCILDDVIKQRYKKELASNNVLYSIIQKAIGEATQLEELWQVTPDAAPINPVKFGEHARARFAHLLPEHLRPSKRHHHHHSHHHLHGMESPDGREEGNAFPGVDDGSLNSHHHLSREGSNRSSKSHHRHNSSAGMNGMDGSIEEDNDVNESEMDSDFDHDDHYGYTDSSDENSSRPSSHTPRIMASSSSKRNSAGNTKQRNTTRRPSVASNSSVDQNSADEKYKRDMLKYAAAKKRLEEKLLKRRAAREQEFNAMGMSPAMAKLAAYNELLLDEQHKLEDFEMINKPKHPVKANKPSTSSQSSVSSSGRPRSRR